MTLLILSFLSWQMKVINPVLLTLPAIAKTPGWGGMFSNESSSSAFVGRSYFTHFADKDNKPQRGKVHQAHTARRCGAEILIRL
jgi:hypothetical protein